MQKILPVLVLLGSLQLNAQKAKLSANIDKPVHKGFSGLPIKPSHTVSFSTNEASWIDVDVSPDGKTLLCSFLGNLYSLPSTGGTAKQLTRGLAINRSPVWSPDGTLKAYMSDATGFMQIHIVDSTAKFHKVLGIKKPSTIADNYNLNPFWLPDNKHVSDGEKVYDFAGGSFNLQEQIKKIGYNLLLGYSNKGNSLYMLIPASHNSTEVSTFDTITGEKERMQIINRHIYQLYTARISPDGKWLTFIKYDEGVDGNIGPADSLMILDLQTGREKLLAHLGIRFTGMLSNQHYSFSSDSKYLFIGYGGKIHRIEISTGKNEIIPFTANVKVDMGELNYHKFPVSIDSFELRYIRSAQKRPDGKQLVFSTLNKIYTMDLPNGKPRVLVEQSFGQFHPSYSPDGKWIAYVTWSSSIKGHVWRIPTNGGKPEQLTTLSELYEHPSWSPDSKKIVVLKGLNSFYNDYPSPLDGRQKIEVINVEDKTTRIYADSVTILNYPKFSKDGRQVIFKPNQKGSSSIWPKLVALDLEAKTKNVVATALKKDDGTLFGIRQIVMSPDGRYLVFLLNEDLYLIPIENNGVTQEIFNEESFIQVIRFARGGIDAVWEKDGKLLSWLSGNNFYSIDPDKIIDAAMKLQPNATLEGLPQTKIIDVNIPSDQVITIRFKAPSLYGKGIIALKNANIITMRGKKIIKSGVVIIENGRIAGVGEASKLTIPKSAMVFDFGGQTIIPGLIDMHGHIGAVGPQNLFNEQSWHHLLNLSYGVCTTRDPSGNFGQFGYGELIKAGYAIGPRLLTVGGRINYEYKLTSEKEAVVAVRNRTNMGATYIKQYAQPTRLQRELLLEACKKMRVNMTSEVEQHPLNCIGQIKDGATGVEHDPFWGEVYNDVITTVAKSGTYMCPALQVCFGFRPAKHYFAKLYGRDVITRSSRFMSENYRNQLENEIKSDVLDTGFIQQSKINARFKHAGGKIVMGSHGEDQGIGAHWEIWALQMGGLTNYEALETATITAAEALGMQKDLGSIEVGKIADLIILDKNPLEDIRNTNTIKYVMKAGVLYESETLDQIWPNKVKCPEWRMKAVK